MADLKVNQVNGDIAVGQPGGGFAVYKPGQYKYNAKTNQYAVQVDGGWQVHDGGPRKPPPSMDQLLRLPEGTAAREGTPRDQLLPDNRTALNKAGEQIKGFGRETVNTMLLGGGDEFKAALDAALRLHKPESPGENFVSGVADQQRARSEFETTSPGTALAAKIGGTVLNPLNMAGAEFATAGRSLLGNMGRSAAVGGGIGGTGGVLSTDGDLSQRAAGGAMGLGIGGLAGGALPILTAGMTPKISPEVQLLMSKGITPTPGQIIGGAAGKIEEKLASLPIAGDMIAAGRRRAQGELNVAVGNDVLAPIGKKTTAAPGRDLVADVERQIKDEYDSILPKITFVQDQQLTNEVAQLQNIASMLPDTEAKQFQRIIDDIDKRMKGGTTLSGEEFKIVESELGKLKAQFGKDPSAYVNQLGEVVGDLQQALRDSLPRTNPMQAKPLQNANAAWAKFKRLQRAATYVGGKEGEPGVFSGDQFQSAVKATDRSKDKGAFARGNAQMQDLSDAAKNVLGSKVPDSGTPGRLAAMLAGTGGLGLLKPTTLAATGLLTLPYTGVGQRAAAGLLTRMPGLMDRTRRMIPFLGNVSGQTGGTIASPPRAR
jgi:hypothetical protein